MFYINRVPEANLMIETSPERGDREEVSELDYLVTILRTLTTNANSGQIASCKP